MTPDAVGCERLLRRLLPASAQLAVRDVTDVKGADVPPELAGAVDRRVAQFSAGRRCACDVLTRLGLPPVAPAMGSDRAPQWPSGIAGSISHTDALAACAAVRIEDAASLGIDLLPALDDEALCAVNESAFTTADRAWVAGDRHRAGMLFSAKESLFKAVFPLTHHAFELEDAELSDAGEGWVALVLLRTLTPGFPKGRVTRVHVAVEQGLTATACVLSAA